MTIHEFIDTFPRGGGYLWKDGDGVTEPIVYQGKTILKPDANQSSYCCGLTFQGWFKTHGYKLQIPLKEMESIRRLWYITDLKIPNWRKGAVLALVPRGLAVEVKLQDVQKGDIGQIWRVPTKGNPLGSGHSIFPLSQDGALLTYFSTQPLTKGAGERREKLNTLAEMYFCRPT